MTSDRVNKTKSQSLLPGLVLGQFILLAGLVIAASVLLAIAGPFGTFERGDFLHRLVYWSVVCVASLVIALTAKHFINVFCGSWTKPWREASVIVATTVVFTPFLQWWSESAYPGFAGSSPGGWYMAGLVGVICVSLSVLLHGVRMVLTEAEPVRQQPSAVRLARRLSADFDGRILRLSAEGHTVLVYTDQGIFRVRMRLTDAIDEMGGVKGYCAHRSHWVTEAAITGAERGGGKLRLTLTDGSEVPVSRKYQPDLEAAGLL